MEEVLLMYSGGKDSTYTACILASKGYIVNLINYDNGFTIGTDNIEKGANELKRIFPNNINYFGIDSTAGFIRSFMKLENNKFSEIVNKYGDITISQYHCLLCRSAMYLNSILIALEMDINIIAEGARKSQLFAIEDPSMIECFRDTLAKYDIKLLTPILDEDDNYKVENNLYYYGINKHEAKCLYGYPLNEKLDNETLMGIKKIYKEIVEPEIERLVDEYKDNEYIGNPKLLRKDHIEWL